MHLVFQLICNIFSQNCHSTVWTLGYVVPYHVKNLYDSYKIGYGILSMQGKEAKHSEIKQELKSCSNRHIEGEKNKWYQLMQSSYVRTFYLPYHYPVKAYNSHFESRNTPLMENMCECCRQIGECVSLCDICLIIQPYINDIGIGEIPDAVNEIRKPIVCSSCNFRSATHKCFVDTVEINPRGLTVLELKKMLDEKGERTSGNTEVLCQRLEYILAYEKL